MEAKDVVVGMKVYLDGDRFSRVTVKSEPNPNGFVNIKYSGGSTHQVHHDHISLIDEEDDKKIVADVQLNIDKVTAALEIAFDILCSTNECLHHYGSSLVSMSDEKLLDLTKMEEIVEKIGWRSSTLYCQ
jgi:hypothetical protein